MVELGIEAVGTLPLAYQWRRDGVDLIDGGPIGGVNTAMLTISATAQDTGVYDVVVSNSEGQTISDGAVIAVRPSCVGDINGDGNVNSDDLGLLLGVFGTMCP